MQFRDASGGVLNISNVRTVFWVAGMDAGIDGFLLGDDNNYHFHRGTEGQMWDAANGWAHANIRDGSTYLDGVQVDGTATQMPTDYSIISLVTTGNIETSMLARDRTYRSGGIKLGETADLRSSPDGHRTPERGSLSLRQMDGSRRRVRPSTAEAPRMCLRT